MKKLIIVIFIAFMQHAVLAQPGTIDTKFGNNGIALSNNLFSRGSAVAIQKDKKVLVTGKGFVNEKSGMLTTRFKEDGTIDSSFGSNGSVVLEEEFCCSDEANNIFVLSDGKILVGGYYRYYDNIRGYDACVIKYNVDGTLDESFGNGGFVTTNISFDDNVADMALQSDGKIIMVGYSKYGDFDNWIVRYMPDGRLDESFGNKGTLGLLIDPLAYTTSVTIQLDNKILVGSNEQPGRITLYTVRRYLENGAVDESFGENGRATFRFPENNYYNGISDIGLQKDGQILVGGTTGYPEARPALVRFTTNGKIDSSFGSNGYTILFKDKKETEYYDLNGFVMQEDEKLLLSGYFRSDTEGIFAARLNKNGIPDSSYGENSVGKIVLPVVSRGGRIDLQNDGKLTIAGSYSNTEGVPQLMAVRFNGDPTKPRPTIAQIKRWIRNHILHFEDTNTNAAYYVIEKSTTNNGAFVPVTKITANAATNYSYTLPEAATQNTYRIKAVNKDNSITYSSPISSSDPAKAGVASFKIYPNPAKDRITVETTGTVQLRLQNSNGRVLLTQTVNGKGSIDISKLPNGIYYVVNTLNGKSLKVVKE